MKLYESFISNLKEASNEDSYQPKYKVLDINLLRTNGGSSGGSDTVFGTIKVKSEDNVGNLFDIIYTPDMQDPLKVFPRGTDVKTVVEELFNIDSPESELEWINLHGSRLQRRDLFNFMKNESLNISDDMKNDIIYGLDILRNNDDIDKVIGGWR